MARVARGRIKMLPLGVVVVVADTVVVVADDANVFLTLIAHAD